MDTLYDDAELVALQMVREAVLEDGAPPEHSYSAKVLERLIEMQERHGSPTHIAVPAALARLVVVAWSAALTSRLGHLPSQEEMLAEVDRFEMHKIEQHQAERDDPEDDGGEGG
jgi:hypothetical protein